MKGSIRIILGLLIILGVAGADCDGKCMENAMSMTEILLYSAGGFAFMLSGIFAAKRNGAFGE